MDTDDTLDHRVESPDENTQRDSYGQQLSSKQSAAVFRLKLTVILAFFIASITVTALIYNITDRGESSQFETHFEGASNHISESFKKILLEKVYALSSLGTSITGYVRSQPDVNWPNVTMPDFQERAALARSLSDSLYISFAPIVEESEREGYEEFVLNNYEWLPEAWDYQANNSKGWESIVPDQVLVNRDIDEELNPNHIGAWYKDITRVVFGWDPVTFVPGPVDSGGPYFPVWQLSPLVPEHSINFDLSNYTFYTEDIKTTVNKGEVVLGQIALAPPGNTFEYPHAANIATFFYSFVRSFDEGRLVEYHGDPNGHIYIPVFDSFDKDRKIEGFLLAIMGWGSYFEDVLPDNSDPVYIVLENPCDGPFTYLVDGNSVQYIGQGNLYDKRFEQYEKATVFSAAEFIERSKGQIGFNQDRCGYSLRIYPTEQLYKHFNTSMPTLLTSLVAGILIFTILTFLFYNRLVERRQEVVLGAAVQNNKIVSNVFPERFHERLMESAEPQETKISSDEKHSILLYKAKPIADLFLEATVMFADVAGFTAWSSTREPSQVFILLETLYGAFDKIADQRRVYKVETVGDCYVAVAGVPEPRSDHAIVMARFARDCIIRCKYLTEDLEVLLGPGTGDLRMRFGLHSGPITAGVLRGSRSRFQLFGDTVNTAARMESTGISNRVHLSSTTAELLQKAGKSSWLVSREESVFAKGKGELHTFFLKFGNHHDDEMSCAGSLTFGSDVSEVDAVKPVYKIDKQKTNRLVQYNVDVLSGLLKQVVANQKMNMASNVREDVQFHNEKQTVIDEVSEIIELPSLDHSWKGTDPETVQLPVKVTGQLHDYVKRLSMMYRMNPFHNFEHASHVTQSVAKLLSRIVAPKTVDSTMEALHDHTYGITSDPLTQFACVLSALIHDCDHLGISNAQLVEAGTEIAQKYRNQSVAEQNSVDLAWDLLMGPAYKDLRATIYSDQQELQRFRKLVVNSVMATDIIDKDLKALRNARWEAAFAESNGSKETAEDVNRKATIVIDHLIQASDVSHTMQHWHIYRKWNERLFEEMYKAYKEGHMEKDPCDFWYKGEIGFFDFYIIPLAKKLKECGVFGVSSGEYLSYAEANRKEWEDKGMEVVASMKERMNNLSFNCREEGLPEEADQEQSFSV